MKIQLIISETLTDSDINQQESSLLVHNLGGAENNSTNVTELQLTSDASTSTLCENKGKYIDKKK